MSVSIYYHIPSDLDDENHPNVFYIEPQGKPVTLSLVRNSFPLPGQYHFRFKTNFKNTFVWKDCSSDNDKISAHNGKYVAKVSRLRSATDTPVARTTTTTTTSQSSSSSTNNNNNNNNNNNAARRQQRANRPTSQTTTRTRPSNNHQQQQPRQTQPKAPQATEAASNSNASRTKRVASNGSDRERRYSDLLHMEDMDDISSLTSQSPTPPSDTGSNSSDLLRGSGTSTPTGNSSDLSGLGGLDFGAPAATMPMRNPSHSFGGTSMDALNPMNMQQQQQSNNTGGFRSGSGGPRSINTQSNGSKGGQKKIGSPRSQALNGFLGGL